MKGKNGQNIFFTQGMGGMGGFGSNVKININGKDIDPSSMGGGGGIFGRKKNRFDDMRDVS